MSTPVPKNPDRLAYPALLRHTPVLTRAPGVLQIGLDQEPALLLVDVPADLDRVLQLLDGCHHQREIRSRAAGAGIGDSVVDWVLRTLDGAGLLEEVSWRRTETPLKDRSVRLVGAGVLGRAVADLLAAGGVGTLYLVDGAPTDPTLYPRAGALGTQAEALRARLVEPDDRHRRVLNHWSKPDGLRPDLTVVASDHLECDRVVLAGLLRQDQPHLVLRPRAGGVVVGPLVIPGRTGCLHCADLARRDADPQWPTLLTQLQRTRMAVTAVLAGWAGAVGAAQVLGFLQGDRPEAWGATLEISPRDFVTHRRSWPMHPGCGCGWQATAEWGA